MNTTSGKLSKFVKFCYVKDAEFEIVIAFPSMKYYINYLICCAVNVFLTLSTIFLNATTVLAYWKSPRLKKKTTYFLVMILSLNDFEVGVLCNSTFTVHLVSEILGYGNCSLAVLFSMSSLALSSMSFMTLFILSIERYLGIFHPIFHRNKLTKRILLITVIGIWCLCIIGPCAQVISNDLGKVMMTSVIALVLINLACIYVKIFRCVTKVVLATEYRNSNVEANSGTPTGKRQKDLLRKKKQAKSCFVVVVCTLVCFLPLTATSHLEETVLTEMGFMVWSITFVYVASSLNSLTFFWQNQTLRSEAKKILLQVFLKS